MLAGVGLLATGGVAELVPIGGIEDWSPRRDTWPLAHYDLANTASTDATPPTSPNVAWSSDRLGEAFYTGLVVGPERVYAGGRGLVALDRADGSSVWVDEEVGSGHLALREGTLYSASAVEGPRDYTLDARDAAAGGRVWRSELPFEATSLLVADGAAFVGHNGLEIWGFDAGSGRHRWSADVFEDPYLGVHGGDLYATVTISRVVRYRGRDLLDVPFGSGPDVRWESESPADDAFGPPVATDAHVYTGQRSRDRPALVACHRSSGEVAWSAVDPAPDTDRTHATTALAVDEERGGVAGLARDADGPGWRSRVVGFDPTEGPVRWRTALDAERVSTAAVATDLALVGTADAEEGSPGTVRALSLDSGAERWRVELPAGVRTVAPVEGTVFVACRDGSVHALRD